MSQTPNEINLRIAAYRKLAGMTQAEAAKALNMKRNTYGRMELHGNPTPEILKKLAKLYNVTVSTLLYGAEQETEGEKKPDDIVIPPDTTPKTAIFREPIDSSLEPVRFIPTASEINLIKAYRIMSNEQKKEIRELIEKLYREKKNK